jgi:hypothetical protein
VAPFEPHAVQRAHWRSRSLDVSGPHRMISGTNAIGAWWWHRSRASGAGQALAASPDTLGRAALAIAP